MIALVVLSPAAVTASDGGDRQLLGEESSVEDCPKRAVRADTPSGAKRLTLYGVACFKRQKFAQAYTFYHRAYEIEPSDLLRAAMGRSLHELGIYEVAEHYYTSYLDGVDDQTGTRQIERRLGQLRQTIDSKAAKVDLRSFPQNATVSAQLPNGGWVELGATPMRVALRTGVYRFKFKRPGYRHRTLRRRLPSSEDVYQVEADLYHQDALFDATAHQIKKAGAVTATAALPILTAGGIFFGMTKDTFDEAEDYTYRADYVPAEQNRLVARGHRYQRWAIGLTAVGGATLLTGAVLFFRGKSLEPDTKPEESATRMRPVLAPRFVGVRGRF